MIARARFGVSSETRRERTPRQSTRPLQCRAARAGAMFKTERTTTAFRTDRRHGEQTYEPVAELVSPPPTADALDAHKTTERVRVATRKQNHHPHHHHDHHRHTSLQSGCNASCAWPVARTGRWQRFGIRRRPLTNCAPREAHSEGCVVADVVDDVGGGGGGGGGGVELGTTARRQRHFNARH